ncbi:MAG: ABC transporter permease [Chitinophagales bacterium]|nr:ABC transporter permease [Chitinophagales bacterium]
MIIKHISAKQDTVFQYLNKIWEFKSMIRVFVSREIKVRYAQTRLRTLWLLFHPIIQATLYIFFFQYVFNIESSEVVYPIFVLSGLIAWNLFSNSMMQSLNGMNESISIIKKVYFPRIIVPISKSIVVIFEVMLSFLLLIFLMILYQEPISIKIFFLPFIFLGFVILAISISIWIGAFSFKNRDILQALPYVINLLIWFTPVFIPVATYPEFLRPLLYFNPIAGLLEAWRASLFLNYIFDTHYLYSILSIIPLFIGGLWIFSRHETKYIDLI